MISKVCPRSLANDETTLRPNAPDLTPEFERTNTHTLVFSGGHKLNEVPAGYAAEFKMLHIQTGQLYHYHLCISKHRYQQKIGNKDNEKSWRERIFFALTVFVKDFYREYGCFPSASNIYHEGRSYSDSGNFFGKKICFKVSDHQTRQLWDNQLDFSC